MVTAQAISPYSKRFIFPTGDFSIGQKISENKTIINETLPPNPNASISDYFAFDERGLITTAGSDVLQGDEPYVRIVRRPNNILKVAIPGLSKAKLIPNAIQEAVLSLNESVSTPSRITS